MDYTQEQLDQMIADAVKTATTGMFSEDELNRRVTAEVDRRVESGIQKGIETQKQKWQEEADRKAKMTAEELAKEQLAEQTKTLTTRELEIKKRANTLDAKDLLADAGIPKAQYEKFIDILVSDDDEVTKANVTNFVDMFNNTKLEIETKVKSEFTKVPSPSAGNNEPVTQETFKKMSYSEKLKFKEENPELYKEFIKG